MSRFARWAIKIIWKFTKWIGRGLWTAVQWIAGKIHFIGRRSIEKGAEGLKEHKVAKQQPKNMARARKFELVKKFKGGISSFENQLYSKSSLIGIILGARGTGKSAIGMFLLENFKSRSEKRCYAMGFKQNSVPRWIKVVKSIEEIENDAVLLIDEGGIEFSSRSSMSDANKLLSEILLIARHKDLTVLFITQNSSNLEVNAIRQTDFLLLKPSSLLQKDFERKKIKNIYSDVQNNFDEYKEVEGLVYVYSDKFRGFVTNPLPLFWSEKTSKGYAKR